MSEIKTFEQWHALAGDLREAGYTIWQMQYSASQPEGFHAWFWAKGKPEIEIVTHNKEVQKAMAGYRLCGG